MRKQSASRNEHGGVCPRHGDSRKRRGYRHHCLWPTSTRGRASCQGSLHHTCSCPHEVICKGLDFPKALSALDPKGQWSNLSLNVCGKTRRREERRAGHLGTSPWWVHHWESLRSLVWLAWVRRSPLQRSVRTASTCSVRTRILTWSPPAGNDPEWTTISRIPDGIWVIPMLSVARFREDE